MIQISLLLSMLSRFACWYPAFIVGVVVWICAFFLYDPVETFRSIPLSSYLLLFLLNFILWFQLITLFFKRRGEKKKCTPDQKRLFHSLFIAACALSFLLITPFATFFERLALEKKLEDHLVLHGSQIEGVVQNRSLAEFYGKPTWSITIKIIGIKIKEKEHQLLEKIMVGKSYRIRSAPPSPVTCGSLFSLSADIKIDKNGPGSWKIAIKPKWKTAIISGTKRLIAYFGEARLHVLFYIQNIFFQLYPESSRIRSVLLSLLFGFPLEKDIKADIHRAGVDHLFTVSGFHFNCVYATAGMALFACSLRLRNIGALISSLLFLFIVGIQAPSVIRSWWTIGLSAIAPLFGLQTASIHIFSLTLAFIVFNDPAFVFATGFQLSFLATWGILLYSAPIAYFLSKNIFIKRDRSSIEEMRLIDQILYAFLRLASSALALALSVWVFLIPYSFSFLDGFTPFAFIYNLLLPPLFSVALISGLFSIIGGQIWSQLGFLFAFCTKIWVKIGFFLIDASEGASLLIPTSLLFYLSKKQFGSLSFLLFSMIGIFVHIFFKEQKTHHFHD